MWPAGLFTAARPVSPLRVRLLMPALPTQHGTMRAMTAMQAFYAAKADYEASLKGLEEGSEAYEAAQNAVFARSAEEALSIARANGGVYVKAAQFIASMQGGGGDKARPPCAPLRHAPLSRAPSLPPSAGGASNLRGGAESADRPRALPSLGGDGGGAG